MCFRFLFFCVSFLDIFCRLTNKTTRNIDDWNQLVVVCTIWQCHLYEDIVMNNIRVPLTGMKTVYSLVTRRPYLHSRASQSVATIAVIDFSPTTLASRALFVNMNLQIDNDNIIQSFSGHRLKSEEKTMNANKVLKQILTFHCYS